FAEEAARQAWDLVYVSHGFYGSGYIVPDLEALVGAGAGGTPIIVDGYHTFFALPIALRGLHQRVFYTAGGYKYAMAGEGCCFLHAPHGIAQRPRDTGWFAAFAGLRHARAQGAVPYAPGAARFLGGTVDPTPIYRLDAVLTWLASLDLTPEKI